MGNQENKIGNGFNFVNCRIDEVNYPFYKPIQLEDKNYKNYQQRNIRNPKGIKRFSSNRSNTRKLQKLSFERQNEQQKAEGKIIFNKGKINTDQKHPHFIHNQMQKAYKFMKSLNLLQKFQQKFNKEYPILILNKQSHIKRLRQEISREKMNHLYFSFKHLAQNPSLGKQLTQKNNVAFQNLTQNQIIQRIQRQVFSHFMILQKIQWVLIRLFQTGRHSSVLKYLKGLDRQYAEKEIGNQAQDFIQKIDRFVKHVDSLDIELMDMLFYQLKQTNKIHQLGQKIIRENALNKIPRIVQKSNQQTVFETHINLINVKQLIIKNKQSTKADNKGHLKNDKSEQNSYKKQRDLDSYEYCKQFGWQIYKQNKVCFYILAMGNQPFCPELQPLNIPFNPTIIQLLLERYDAFAQILQLDQMTVNIIIDAERIPKLQQIKKKNNDKCKRLNLRVLKCEQLPFLDIEGNFMIGQNNIRKGSIGTADLWNCIQEDSNQLQMFQYVEVMQARNCLQCGFDCFMLGKIKKENLQWGTKVFQPIQRLTQLSFINSESNNNKIPPNQFQSLFREPILTLSPSPCLFYPSQNNYFKYLTSIKQRQQTNYVFGSHSVMSMNFVKKVLKERQNSQNINFRKKTIVQDSQKFIAFQRDFIDQAIQQTIKSNQKEFKKWGIFIYERNDSYYPLNFKENKGIFDILGCSSTLNHNYLSKLDLSVNKFLQKSQQKALKCYIDPHVSLEGQGLDDIKLQIERRINQVLSMKQLKHSSTQLTFSKNQFIFEKSLSKFTQQNLEIPMQNSGISYKNSERNKLTDQRTKMTSTSYQRNNHKLFNVSTNKEIQSKFQEQELIPSQVVSSITEIVILSNLNSNSQNQISIFIN